jgi:hypothetical protein
MLKLWNGGFQSLFQPDQMDISVCQQVIASQFSCAQSAPYQATQLSTEVVQWAAGEAIQIPPISPAASCVAGDHRPLPRRSLSRTLLQTSHRQQHQMSQVKHHDTIPFCCRLVFVRRIMVYSL